MQAAYTFHAGALCIVHASEARQHAPGLVLTPIAVVDDLPTDPNYDPDGPHVTRPVGSVYPDDKPIDE
jgi:hypothetical protein